ncbi:MAG: hypothetical protein KDK60_01595 [Chlamydiia bacterium]|nr:hypothetical protein [Chlamydiia bacterium]
MDWEKSNATLQATLCQEIALRQELLSNLHQQEYAMLTGESVLSAALERIYNGLVVTLKKVIKEKGEHSRQLFRYAPKNRFGLSLDEILDPIVDTEHETLSLYKKVKDLIREIHKKHLRIKTLNEMIRQNGPLSVQNPAIQSEIQQRGKESRPTLITIDYPEENREI